MLPLLSLVDEQVFDATDERLLVPALQVGHEARADGNLHGTRILRLLEVAHPSVEQFPVVGCVVQPSLLLTVVCPEELCKLEEGTYLGERNFSALNKVLKQYNLEDRFDTFRVSPKYPGEFNAKLEDFKQKISSISKMEVKAN